MSQTLHMGMPTVIQSAATQTPFAALFEDDGKVAYFYAIDTRLGDRSVLDAVYVYNVAIVIDHPEPDLDFHAPCAVEIAWSADEQRAALVINGRAHAAFDFAAKRAYCRTNYPRGSAWSPGGHTWDDHAVDYLAEGTAQAR